MIDVHAHVLPGLDDGAVDMAQAVGMCRMAHRDGTRAIVATPHFYRGLFPTPRLSVCRALREELERRCRETFDPEFRVLLGSDCHVHAELMDNLKRGAVPTVAGSRYLLLELPESRIPPGFADLMFALRLAGAYPVITHPERHAELAFDLELLHGFVARGAYAQVTAASLTGDLGPDIERVAAEMVERHLVQVIASDCHDTEARPPILSRARARAAELVGEQLADRMVNGVPGAMIEDRDAEFPGPLAAPAASHERRRPFWRRWLGV